MCVYIYIYLCICEVKILMHVYKQSFPNKFAMNGFNREMHIYLWIC